MSFGRVIAGEYVPVILFLFDVWPSRALAIIVLAAVFYFRPYLLIGHIWYLCKAGYSAWCGDL